MATTPGALTRARLALLPDGSIAEAALDANGNAYARWYSGTSWSVWWLAGSGASDVDVTAASVSSTDTAYLSVTTGGTGAAGRSVYSLTASGLTGTTL